MHDEARYNVSLKATVSTGELIAEYPLQVKAATGDVLADVSIEAGGIGHVPLIVREVEGARPLVAERYIAGEWTPLEGVNVEDHSYYQGYRNAEGSMDYVFSIPRPSTDLTESWRVRVVVAE